MRWLLTPLVGAAIFHSFLVAASRLTPPVLPLIVRDPYLSTWLGNARDDPWNNWPMFYTGEHLGLSLMAAIPDTGFVYPLLGRPHDSLTPVKASSGKLHSYKISYPTYLGAKYDASTTNLTYSIAPPESQLSAGPLHITVSFLSPITPTSTLRQSIPAAYITVYVKGNRNAHIYMDMNGQWVSGYRGARIVWDFDKITPRNGGPRLNRWRVRRETEQLFTEHSDRSEWGSLYIVAPKDVLYESGTSAVLRKRFARTDALRNVNDGSFRSIMDEEPVFAFSKSFLLNGTGNNCETSLMQEDQVTFTIAHIQDPVVQFAAARGLTMMKPLWQSWFSSVDNLLSFHYFDFQNASALATSYSKQLEIDAFLSGAEDYVDIVALSARQVLGATTFSGTAENPILFLKEISSNGNFQTIDVIFPSFPFFLYTNPRWLAYLLEPLIEHMLSGQYPNTYAMHDLGSHFPNATGHPDGRDEYMPVEECGNMLIMGLAIVNSLRYPAKGSGSPIRNTKHGKDTGIFPLIDLESSGGIDKLDSPWALMPNAGDKAQLWVERSYKLWKQWTGYLVEFSLLPENQLSTDDFAGWLALQTNLALKGIIGINAMSKLSALVGNKADYKYYKNISDTYITKWEEYGFSRDKTHAKLSYDWFGSWTTLYNLYADSLLCFHLEDSLESASDGNEAIDHGDPQKPLDPPKLGHVGFVPKRVYERQSKWYHYVRQKYGLPLDSRHLYTKTDWEFFSMAVSSKNVRHEILQSVAKWLNETVTDRPFTDLHKTEGDGGFPGPNFFARPVIGGHFAFLALERACNGNAMAGLDFLDDEVLEDGYPSCEGDDCPSYKDHRDGYDEDYDESAAGYAGRRGPQFRLLANLPKTLTRWAGPRN
ncbi:glutaminase [Histoplasma capsulatum G186AR]|uniref:Glutaminase n=1 Tax=Ajellomyces capsulatus (strain G186AR / H82 / ATCC MYA-2454 / RMSCC 2432) TaxID=447093 RepID=C0NKS4_AJECG|nr:glutaminase [Histoplasma capsulatum G186AR]EEH08465.1 glutaminase [Histoplasma capsulatum G186AR]